MTKVTFLAMVHPPYDERIWFHQRLALTETGYHVSVISAMPVNVVEEDVYAFEGGSYSPIGKIKKAVELLHQLHPDIIICDTPLAIFAAKYYQQKVKCRIVYDVTEWYPSKKNLVGLSGLKRIIKTATLKIANKLAAQFTNGFIFGEQLKAVPFLKKQPHKPSVFTSYYADLQYIKNQPSQTISNNCNLFYAGSLTVEKGFFATVESVILAAEKCPNTHFTLKIITKQPEELTRKLPSNVTISMMTFMPFEEFCNEITRSDLFLDLRTNDSENTQCLPIKLFYYLACGRPSIFTNLKAIQIDAPDCATCCQLVNPANTEEVAQAIAAYVNNHELYTEHGLLARQLAEKKYNWGNIKVEFVKFITQLAMQ